MALSRDEVNRLLAEAAAAQRGQIHQLRASTLLSKTLAKRTTAVQVRPISQREMREIAVRLDDLGEPPAKA